MSLGTANNFPVHIFSGGTLIGNIRLTVLGTGNVGIGTTSPGFKLEVNGDIAANTTGNTSIRVIRSGTEYGALFNLQTSSANANNIDVNLRATNASGGINFMTGGSTTRMRIDFNGNVMIGTSLATDTIGSLLEVYTPNSGTTVTSFQNPTITILNSDTTNNNYSSLAFRSLDAVGARFTGARISGVFTSHTAGAGTGEMAFLTQLAGTIAERMRLNNTGLSTLVRLRAAQGVDVASANDLTLGTDGNCFEITGTTQINAITTANWTNGSRITLLFTSTPTVKHNTAGGGGTAVILLAGAADFVATAGDTLSLIYSEIGGTNAWREVSRAVI